MAATVTRLKGIAVRVGDNNQAAVLFDTELLRVSCGWTGEVLRLDPARYGIIAPPTVGGSVIFSSLRQPGPPRWTTDITTRGVVSDKQDALVVDTLTLPFDNPYKALMFVSGHDFFEFVVPPSGGHNEHARETQPPKGGTTNCAAICTLHGDVWLVSGIDDKLEKLTWKRFATGLSQPLGLKIVKNQIYVVGRDQITRLHDTNNHGETDFYENFNNDGQVMAN